MEFNLVSEYKPTGDQPKAIRELVNHLESGQLESTLHGVTGSGKTFTMANIITELNRPTLVLCHNKTLAAQLYNEFKNFFPQNAVEYYVSYYDFFQPEAYLPTASIYIEKDLSINEEIEKMRLSATTTLLSGRRDVIVVSSVSCIYGIGNPADFKATSIELSVGDKMTLSGIGHRLVEAHYSRVEKLMEPSTFRVVADVLTVMSAYGEICYRIKHKKNTITEIDLVDSRTGIPYEHLDSVVIYPANLFVTTKERVANAIGQIYVDMGNEVRDFESRGRMEEAQRLKQRVEYDLEMIKEIGYCSGIENYSRYFDCRKPGEPPFCLLNYFPEDFLTIIDESHVTLPQVKGMSGGDSARKNNLVEYGFRLSAAKDNRPLDYEEFYKTIGQRLYVSATPSDYEIKQSEGAIVEQLIRPTGLIDPPMIIRPVAGQIDNVLEEIQCTVEAGDKVLISTITKRLAEEMARYLDRIDVRNRYIHSDITTLDRVKILDEMKKGLFEVLVGVNLLREGLDLPDVALVVIFDADKDGFLRNSRAIIQTSGRAARNTRGKALLYGNSCSQSIEAALKQSNRQRRIQVRYNIEHGVIPRQAQRSGTETSPLIADMEPTPETKIEKIMSSEHSLRYDYSRLPEMLTVAQPDAEPFYHKEIPSVPMPPSEKSDDSVVMHGVVNYKNNDVKYSTDRSLRSVQRPKGETQRMPQERPIEERIASERAAMQECAKGKDFKQALVHRDRMYELIKERDSKSQATTNNKTKSKSKIKLI